MRDGILTVQGRRPSALGAAGEKTHRSERGHGTFRRLITLPSSYVQGDKAEAAVRDGGCGSWCPRHPEQRPGTCGCLLPRRKPRRGES